MIGTVVGNYQIVRKLGEGGMGAVYLGQHTLLGRRAAIKVLLNELSARPDIVNRFFNEARAVTSISDPGIVQVFDFGYHTDGSAFIVMEYLEGEPLDRRLARLGKLPVYEGLRLCRQIASSLAAAHAQRITHRDLKPENIFLVHDGEVASGERSKILDFGIAKLSDDNPGKLKTNTGALMGTPIYMSPEQCRGLAELDHRSDIYSLGCVLFHLITGRPPFEGEGMGDIIAAHIREPAVAPSSRTPEIPPAVDALVLRCLAKAPGDRYQTMIELATAIGQILPHLSSPESPTRYLQIGGPMGGPTPVPPYPSQHPPYPSQHPQHSQPGEKPTTLGASLGQVVPTQVTRPSRKLWGVLAVLVVFGGLGVGAAVVASGESRHAASAPPVTAPVPAPPAVAAPPVAGAAPSPPAVPVAAIPVDAGTPDAPDAPEDAAALAAPPPPVTPPPPKHPPHRPHGGGTAPRTGSSTTPAGCDRSIDTDCDGIPDVR